MVRVVVVTFPGAQTLDVCGPAEVFANASRASGCPLYEVILASTGGGLVRTTAGFALETEPLGALVPRATDTVLVAGGDGVAVAAALRDVALVRWVRAAARVVRIGSVCSGAFVLAEAGVLDGLRAADPLIGLR